VRRMIAALAVLAFVVGLSVFAACKQGKGNRCQITADCEDGLLCSAATGTCVGSGGMNEIDATVPPMDAVKLDGPSDVASDVPADQ
jgi:hypothetical protein